MTESDGTGRLAAQLLTLQDYQDIIPLKSLYLHAMDETTNGKGPAQEFDLTNRLLERMTDDAECEYVGLRRISGKVALATYYKQTVPSTVPFAAHFAHNPLISIEGDRATGRWAFEVSVTLILNGRAEACWGQGSYDDVYVRSQGQWKIQSYRITDGYLTPFADGWVQTRKVAY